MGTKGLRHFVFLIMALAVFFLPVMSVLGKGGGGRSGGSGGHSGGRSGSGPSMSRSSSSRGSSQSNMSSRSSGMSSRSSGPSRSAPSGNRSSGPSISQNRPSSQPRSFSSGRAAPQRSAPQVSQRSSRSVSSEAPRMKSSNPSGGSRAVSSRPVERTVKTAPTSQRSRSSSSSSGMPSVTRSRPGRSDRTAAADVKTASSSRSRVTPSSVSRKIEASVSPAADSKAGAERRERTSASSRYVEKIGRTAETSSPKTRSIAEGTGLKDRQGGRTRMGDSSGDMKTAGMQTERSGSRTFASTRQDQPRVKVDSAGGPAVEGGISRDRSRPEVSRQLSSDLRHVEGNKHWKKHDCHRSDHHDRHDSHCNFYFSWAWSPFSCGYVTYFPYSYYHSWCDYPVGYYGLSYYYPGYHRRFIFVSLGGYWPVGYHYSRYYWYGCHPYYWYGPTLVDPYPAVEEYNTYNTYNYYGDASTTESTGWRYPFGDENYDATDYINKISPVDKPETETAADQCFARAVDLFAAGNYEGAAGQLREAVKQSPEDVVLPFTYAQALFAGGDYSLAAGVLRVAVAQIPDDEMTIYYPRGLYTDEKVLNEQVTALETAISAEPFSTDYHLLLGYQYMGLGDLNKARGALFEAAKNPANQPTVGKLLNLADKLEKEK